MSSPPLHQRLSDEFRSRIASGEWAEGAQVPSEAALCAEFGTSRGPVRQALLELRAEGILIGGRGKSPMVRGRAPQQPVEIFFSFTEWVEDLGRVPGQRTFEIGRRPASTVVARELAIQPGEPVVVLLRLRLIDGEPTMVERSHLVDDVGRLLFDFDTDSGSTFRFLRARGIDLDHARHTIDAVAADEVDVDLLGIDLGVPLLRERRVTSSGDGRPLEYAEDRYRPELATFVVENAASDRSSAPVRLLAATKPAP